MAFRVLRAVGDVIQNHSNLFPSRICARTWASLGLVLEPPQARGWRDHWRMLPTLSEQPLVRMAPSAVNEGEACEEL